MKKKYIIILCIVLLCVIIAIVSLSRREPERKVMSSIGNFDGYMLGFYFDYNPDLGINFYTPGVYSFERYVGEISYRYGVEYEFINASFDKTGYTEKTINNRTYYYKEDIKSQYLSELPFTESTGSYYDQSPNNDVKYGIYYADDNTMNKWEYIYVFNDNIYVKTTISQGSVHGLYQGNFTSIKYADQINISTVRLPEDSFNEIFNFDVVKAPKK